MADVVLAQNIELPPGSVARYQIAILEPDGKGMGECGAEAICKLSYLGQARYNGAKLSYLMVHKRAVRDQFSLRLGRLNIF